MAPPRGGKDRNPPENVSRKSDEFTGTQRAHRREKRGGGEVADWAACDAVKLVSAIKAVTQHGYAIRLGYTRDGGALAIGILGDGEPFTEYVRPTEDIDLYLDGLASDYGK